MNFSQFLFSQLFMNHVCEEQTEYYDLEYRSMFPIMLEHRKLFLSSKYNTDEDIEMKCILNYLINEIKVVV